jgi:hypothetical protein
MNYGMYTDFGNQKVGELVLKAKAQGWDWPRTFSELCTLAHSDAQLLGEATDTVVREYVYDALGFETNFYV